MHRVDKEILYLRRWAIGAIMVLPRDESCKGYEPWSSNLPAQATPGSHAFHDLFLNCCEYIRTQRKPFRNLSVFGERTT